jgi:RHS repeat-associated protein
LSNTLITISDNKIGVDNTNDNLADFYQATVLSATDYYAFGMSMKERSWQSDGYRYGFNGKEKDKDFGDEISDFDARLLNKKIGRWFARDPQEGNYPQVSTYAYSFNNPIVLVDHNGEIPILPIVARMAGSAAADFMLQVSMAYFFEGKTLDQAIQSVNYKEVGMSFLTGIFGGRASGALAEGAGQVIVNWQEKGHQYTVEQGLKDFVLGAIVSFAGDKIGELISKYGYKSLKRGLMKLGLSEKDAHHWLKGACFVAGTKVYGEKGSVSIEKVKKNDKVWAFDEKTGKKALKTVKQVFVRKVDKLVRLRVNGEEILTTTDHPFWVRNTWQNAGLLQIGDSLQLFENKKVAIQFHQIFDTLVTVYNFEVEDFHTYYVTNSKVLVHNAEYGDNKWKKTGGSDRLGYEKTVYEGEDFMLSADFSNLGKNDLGEIVNHLTIDIMPDNKSWVRAMFKVDIQGKNITLYETNITPDSGDISDHSQVGDFMQEIFKHRTALFQWAKEHGFDRIRIQGVRDPKSSSAKKGKVIDTGFIDLSNY